MCVDRPAVVKNTPSFVSEFNVNSSSDVTMINIHDMDSVSELYLNIKYSRTSKIRTPDNRTDWSTEQHAPAKFDRAM